MNSVTYATGIQVADQQMVGGAPTHLGQSRQNRPRGYGFPAASTRAGLIGPCEPISCKQIFTILQLH